MVCISVSGTERCGEQWVQFAHRSLIYTCYKPLTSLWVSTALPYKGIDLFSKAVGDQQMKSWLACSSRSCSWLGKWQLSTAGLLSQALPMGHEGELVQTCLCEGS